MLPDYSKFGPLGLRFQAQFEREWQPMHEAGAEMSRPRKKGGRRRPGPSLEWSLEQAFGGSGFRFQRLMGLVMAFGVEKGFYQLRIARGRITVG